MFPAGPKIYILFFLLLYPLFLEAQVCSGSLGDPVLQVDFGTGSGLGRPLDRSITQYTYNPADCPQDGLYTIIDRTTNCNNSTWHSLTEDHTPKDVNGYMMLVNASFTPGDFYVDTVKGLCANTTYELSAWVMNILKSNACNGNGIQPNLSFSIETLSGTKLGTYNSGDIPLSSSPAWKQFGLFFTTPNTANVVIRLTNNARGGCGNDLVLDDITFSPCGPLIQAAIVGNNNFTNIQICEDDPALFTLNASVSSGYVNPVYQWQLSTDGIKWTDINGANQLAYFRNPSAPGNYYYRLSVNELVNNSLAKCRVASNVLNISVNKKPVPTVSVKGPVCEGEQTFLSAKGGSRYEWSGPGGFAASGPDPGFTASLQSTGTYYVKVITSAGCDGLDSISLKAFPKPRASAGKDETICEGQSVTFNATPGLTYAWSPVKGLSSASIHNPIASPSDTTVYILRYTNNTGCSDTDSININVLKKPEADAGPNLKIFEGEPVTLYGRVKGTSVQYYWAPNRFLSNSSLLSPTAYPTENITYTLNVVSTVGCGLAKDEVFVRVFKKVKAPNAFSPNGDGINDVWKIESLDTYPEASISVFNRQGQEVYFSKGYSRAWDGNYNGKALPAATYYYVIDLKNDIRLVSGWVLIVR